ncbi:MAG: GIY-YIG nuclease family protein [bacterium]|nr:GIY-YIG nuclease family protein [bacterium]
MNNNLHGDALINGLQIEWQPYHHQLAFKLTSLDKIPKAHGLYGLWYHKRCLYVGQAKKQIISERLKQHWKGSHNEYLSDWITATGSDIRISFLIIEIQSRIDELEKYYINKFQPVTNIQYT